jgi:hypothetical protein
VRNLPDTHTHTHTHTHRVSVDTHLPARGNRALREVAEP